MCDLASRMGLELSVLDRGAEQRSANPQREESVQTPRGPERGQTFCGGELLPRVAGLKAWLEVSVGDLGVVRFIAPAGQAV